MILDAEFTFKTNNNVAFLDENPEKRWPMYVLYHT